MTETLMRTVLICHADEPLHYEGAARWLAARSALAGIVVIEDPSVAKRRRVRREFRRVGLIGLLDVLGFRLFHALRFRSESVVRRREMLDALRRRYPAGTGGVPTIHVATPNGPEVRRFIERARPDLAVAFCKHILKPEVFGVPRLGTFVMHPGICPEYRNAHGCFWAIVTGDLERVGMTLLRIDPGVDTGPIFGHYTLPPGLWSASPLVLQHQVVVQNLDAVWERLAAVAAGRATAVPVEGRSSRAWGQPRLSAWLRRP